MKNRTYTLSGGARAKTKWRPKAVVGLALALGLSGCPSSEPTEPTEPTLPPITLHVEVSPGTLTLTAMQLAGIYDGRTDTLGVAVSGFGAAGDADGVALSLEDVPPWLAWEDEGSTFSEGTKTFRIRVRYKGAEFIEEPAVLRLALTQPAGYAYVDEPQSARIVVGGNGKRNSPILLHQGNIAAFNQYANTLEGLKLHYRLVEDVVLEKPVAPEESNWVPIGSYISSTNHSAFIGSFDGDRHTISGLTLGVPDNSYQGLFGFIGNGSVVKNLGLLNVSVAGGRCVGGLAGFNYKGTVYNSYATGEVSGEEWVGGLLGENNGTVHNSYATGEVRGNAERVGGLVGLNSGTVHNSYATGDVSGENYVGGLVGWNYSGTVHNSYATGDVRGEEMVGGLVGVNYNTVHNSYATGDVRGGRLVAGLVGHSGNGTVENSVALNLRVSGPKSIGRVVGAINANYATLTNNHAQSSMDIRLGVEEDGSGGEQKTLSLGGDSLDGLSVSASTATNQYNNVSFWQDLTWNFTEDWQWGPNNLPILRDVGGVQNHRVP